MFTVFVLLGLRRSEVLGLRWDDIDLDQGVLRIRRSLHRVEGKLAVFEPKTRGSHRSVPLPTIVVRALGSRRSGCMISATAVSRCSWRSAYRRAPSWRSSDTAPWT
jgi:integrase